MERLVREKRASGYKYDTPARVLKELDQFLCGMDIKHNELPKVIVDAMVGAKSARATINTATPHYSCSAAGSINDTGWVIPRMSHPKVLAHVVPMCSHPEF